MFALLAIGCDLFDSLFPSNNPGTIKRVELTKVRMLIHKNDRQRAVETFRDIESRWPLLGNGYNLEAARRWLQRTSGAALVPAVRSKTRAATDRILKPLRR